MVQRHIWCLYLLRMFECASEYGRAYQLRQASSLRCSACDPHSLTACRSTNLDSWQLQQLRTMKVGGNASASDFFTKHGGSTLLADSDTRKKYTSRVAELYKEELAKRVKEDVVRQALVNRFFATDGISHRYPDSPPVLMSKACQKLHHPLIVKPPETTKMISSLPGINPPTLPSNRRLPPQFRLP